MMIDPSQDLTTVADGLEAVTVWSHDLGDSYAVPAALRRAVCAHDPLSTGGLHRAIDTVWHAPGDGELAGVNIKPGWFVFHGATIWRVLEASSETLAVRWRLVCRILEIDTSQTVTIQQAQFSQTVSGAPAAVWSDFAPDVIGRLVPESSAADHEKRSRRERVRARLYTLTPYLLDTNYRVFDGANYWNVTGYEQPERIDQLPLLRLERDAWPLA